MAWWLTVFCERIYFSDNFENWLQNGKLADMRIATRERET